MENIRIFKERSELALYNINTNDTMYSIIEKLNKNFAVLREYQGGRQGVPGFPGLPGCSGIPDFMNEDLDDDGQIISTLEAKSLCLSMDAINSEEIEGGLEIIYNKWAHKPLILTNFSQLLDGNAESVVVRKYNEPDLSYPFVMDNNFDTKLTIFNSDKSGRGKHLNLVNSKAVVDDRRYGCNSGFSISSDKKTTTNLEELVISGNKNETIENHTHAIILENDYSVIRKNETSQSLILDSGISEDGDFSGRIHLQEQTDDNDFRLPNRTGWVGVWQDTLNSEEFWEFIPFTDIVISKINYKLKSGGGSIIAYEDDFNPIKITNKTIIRFKRLNNFVLIEYHINIKSELVGEDIKINNIKFDIRIPTVGCGTLIWSDGCYYNNPGLDADEFDSQFTNYFKIYNIKIKDSKSFGIVIKNNPNMLISKDNPNDNYYLDGQVWATVEDGQTICDDLIIVNEDSCDTMKIIKQ